MIITDELARRLEAAEAVDAAGCADAARRIDAESGAAVRAIGGGVLAFCGETSPLTHALGIGMHGPVTEEEIDSIEEFFESRRAPVVIDVCPHAHPSLREALSVRGYRVSEMNNVLVRALPAKTEGTRPEGIRAEPASDADVFARTVMAGFFGRDLITDEELRLGHTLFRMPCSTPLLASIDNEPAGACGLSMRNGIASLYGDAVLMRFRGRGVHGATIAERLRLATEAGCGIATAGTEPGSQSHRNYQRLGFEVAYTKTTMVLS